MPALAKVVTKVRDEDNGLTLKEAKHLIGWEVEPEGKDFGDNFALKDGNGKKVRLLNNPSNRPFGLKLALKYLNEILRGKWALNGETFAFDLNGHVQNGQHRLVGFILACEQLIAEGKEPITIPCIIVTGISPKPETVDTIDLGKRRSLGDVVFRNRTFGKKLDNKSQKKLSSTLSHAVRLVWLRMNGKLVSNAPHFPHSEALDFADANPLIEQAVQEVTDLDTEKEEKNRISRYISLAYAAGLLYLMGTAKSKSDEVAKHGHKAIDTSKWARALKFWKTFASGVSTGSGDLFHILRKRLDSISADSGQDRDEICGTVIKAYELYLAGEVENVSGKQLSLKRKRTESGKMVLNEEPRLGGLDQALAVVETVEEEPAIPAEPVKEPEEQQTAAAEAPAA